MTYFLAHTDGAVYRVLAANVVEALTATTAQYAVPRGSILKVETDPDQAPEARSDTSWDANSFYR
jgi:hypothetical protein